MLQTLHEIVYRIWNLKSDWKTMKTGKMTAKKIETYGNLDKKLRALFKKKGDI